MASWFIINQSKNLKFCSNFTAKQLHFIDFTAAKGNTLQHKFILMQCFNTGVGSQTEVQALLLITTQSKQSFSVVPVFNIKIETVETFCSSRILPKADCLTEVHFGQNQFQFL